MIEDILLKTYGSAKPSAWERNTAFRTARLIDDILDSFDRPKAHANITATLRVAYFDRDGSKATQIANQILAV